MKTPRFQYHVAIAGTLGPQGTFRTQRECARFVGYLFRTDECNEVRVWREQAPTPVRRAAKGAT